MATEIQPLLKVGEVAALLGCSERSVYNRVYEGKLALVKIGGSTRFERAEVERFVAEQRGDVDPQEGAQA